MANVHLASVAITDEMLMMTRRENDETTSSSTSSPEDFIQKALMHWSTNPRTYKLWADYHRRKCSERSSLENVCTLYEKAAEHASYWRTVALEKMEDKDDDENTVATAVVTNVNEWVELRIRGSYKAKLGIQNEIVRRNKKVQKHTIE